jgi:hypothetical protein
MFQRSLLPPSSGLALMMEAVSTSVTSVYFYQATRRHNLEDSHLHTRRRENLKSYFARRDHMEFKNTDMMIILIMILRKTG